MFSSADRSSDAHLLYDPGFVATRPPKRPSRAAARAVPAHVPTTRSDADIALFNARRSTYDRRTLPTPLKCAPKGGRLLCVLEVKFVSHGFTWVPVIRSTDGLTMPFGHNNSGYAVLTENNAKAIGDRAPAGTLVTVILDSKNDASLYKITVRPNGDVIVGELLCVFHNVAMIDVECTNMPTFNGQNVTFEDLYHQKHGIFDPPQITSAD